MNKILLLVSEGMVSGEDTHYYIFDNKKELIEFMDRHIADEKSVERIFEIANEIEVEPIQTRIKWEIKN